MVIKMDTNLLEIVGFQHVKPGKGGAFVRSKLKNVITGRVLDKTFRAGEKVDEARLEETTYQYLYEDGDLYHFMDKETYDQTPVGAAIVGDKKNWLIENMDVGLLSHDGKVIALNLPLFVEMDITKCDPGLQGDRSSGGTKPATLTTGVTVQVPLFVNEGDKIKVDTRTGEYMERVS
jgi:elongation factor P